MTHGAHTDNSTTRFAGMADPTPTRRTNLQRSIFAGACHRRAGARKVPCTELVPTAYRPATTANQMVADLGYGGAPSNLIIGSLLVNTPKQIYIFRSRNKKAIAYNVDREAGNLPEIFAPTNGWDAVMTSGTAWLRVPVDVRDEIVSKGFYIVNNVTVRQVLVPRAVPDNDPYWSAPYPYVPIEIVEQIFPWWESKATRSHE